MTEGRTALCVFAKPPRAGQAKTRLAAAIGPGRAARLARAFFEDAWTKASACPWAEPVLATTDEHDPLWNSVRGSAVTWPQGDGDLGARMERILIRALVSFDSAIAIGTDSPAMPVSRLDEARAALISSDAVIGPSEDGGFYLLGLRRCPPGLLAGIAWGTSEARAHTVSRLRDAGLTLTVLAECYDIDRPDDLDRASRTRGLWRTAPATAKALEELPDRGKMSRGTPQISVIVPTLNEGQRIGAQLARLAGTAGLDEVIVADGGSTDATREIVLGSGTARLVSAPPGRGPQMNAGAAAAIGDVVLFLHADVTLPPDAAALIARALRDPAIIGGAFRIRTVADGRHGWPRRLLWLADLRSRYSRLPYGDQAIFVRRRVFETLGGFAALPLFEDLDFSRRLKRAGRLRVIDAAVEVSGRRFMTRPIYFACVMNVLPALYRLGVPPRQLVRLYGHVR